MSTIESVVSHEPLRRKSGRFWAIRALAGPAALLLIVIGFFWKLVLTNQFSWLQGPDPAYQIVPWFQYEARELQQHRIPIWDPFLFGGQSLIGQDQPGLAYPPNWLLFAAPFQDGHISFPALNWYFMFIHYFAALFAYLLCRDLGRSTLGALAGGLAFGLGGYMGTNDWPQMINGAVWTPLVFLFLFRSARGVRPVASAAFSGLFLGVSWLSGHHQVPIFLTLAAGGVWLYFLFEHGRVETRRLLPLAVFLAFFVCAGALQMWPAFSYGRTALRWVGAANPLQWDQAVPYIVHQRYSLSPIYLLGIVIPGFHDVGDPFVGVVALSLVALALACWWKTKELRILFGVGVAGLFLALARNDVFHGILYSIVPLFEKARTPAAALFLFHFAVAVLLAFGLDALFQASMKSALRRLMLALLAFGGATFLIAFGILFGKALKWGTDDRVMMSVLAAFALAGLIYRARAQAGARIGILILIMTLYLVEIGNVSGYDWAHAEEKDRNVYTQHYAETRQVVEFLQRQPAPLRVWVNSDDVPFNFGDWYGMDTMLGYTASMPFNFYQAEPHTARTRMLYGAAYTISKKPLFEGQQEVFRGDNGLAVYKSPSVLPRVWTVHEGVQVKDPMDMRRHLQDPGFELQKKTFGYEPPPPMEQCDGDVVQSFSRGINQAKATVEMKCRGMVVMSENNAPGWIATVDGKPSPIYDAYTTLRGVVAGPGKHTIETRYRPLSVIAGAATTLAALLGALALCIVPRLGARRVSEAGDSQIT